MDNPERESIGANEQLVTDESMILKERHANEVNGDSPLTTEAVEQRMEENGNSIPSPMEESGEDDERKVLENGTAKESIESDEQDTEAAADEIVVDAPSSPTGEPENDVEGTPNVNGVVKESNGDETSETKAVEGENQIADVGNAPSFPIQQIMEEANDNEEGIEVDPTEADPPDADPEGADALHTEPVNEEEEPIHYYVPMSPIIEGAGFTDLFYDGPEVNYYEEEIVDDSNVHQDPENTRGPHIQEDLFPYPIEGAAMPDQQMEDPQENSDFDNPRKRPTRLGRVPRRRGPHTPSVSPPRIPFRSPQYDELDADYRMALALQEEEDRMAQDARRSNWSNQASSSSLSANNMQPLERRFVMDDGTESESNILKKMRSSASGEENCSRKKKEYDECWRLFNQCIDERAEEFVPTPYSIEGFEEVDYIRGYREVLSGHPFPLHKPVPPVPPGSPKGPETSPLRVRTEAYRIVSNPVEIPLEQMSSGNERTRSREPLARVPNVSRLFGELPSENNNNDSGIRMQPTPLGSLVNENKRRRLENDDDLDVQPGPASRRRLDFTQAQNCRDEELEFQRAVEESKREYELSRNALRSRDSGAGPSNSYGAGPSSGSGAGSSRDYGEGSSSSYGAGPSSSNGAGSSRDYGEGSSSSYRAGSSRDYGEGPSTNYRAGSSSSYGARSSRDYGEGPSSSYGAGSSTDYGEGPSTSYGAGSSSSYYRSGPRDSYGAGPSNRYDEGPSDSYGAGPSTSDSGFRYPLQPVRLRKPNPHRRNGLTESSLLGTSSTHYSPLSPLSPIMIPQDSHLYRPNSNQEEDDVFTLDAVADVNEQGTSSTTMSHTDPRYPTIKWDDPENMPPLEKISAVELKKMPEDYIEAIKIEQSIKKEPEDPQEPAENQENDDEAAKTRQRIDDYILIIRSYLSPDRVVPNAVFNTRFEVYIRFPFLQRPLYVQNVLAALLIPDNRGDILPRMPEHIRNMTVPQFFKYAGNMAMGLRLRNSESSYVIIDAELRDAAREYLQSMEIFMLELFPEHMVYDGMQGLDVSKVDLRMYEMFRDQVVEEKKDHVIKKLMQDQSRLVADSHSVTDCRQQKYRQSIELQSPDLPELGAAFMASPAPFNDEDEKLYQGVVANLLSNPELAAVEQQAIEDEANERIIRELMESMLLNLDEELAEPVDNSEMDQSQDPPTEENNEN